MHNGKRILAIIPARGGSKGLPGKNTRLLSGKPLIQHTIAQAAHSQYLDAFVVSTDSPAIAAVARRAGARVIPRPKQYAKDTSPMIDAVRHVIDTMRREGETFDIIVLLEPTSPLRRPGDIDAALDLFVKRYRSADAVVSVGRVGLEHPSIMKTITKRGHLAAYAKAKQVTRRQALPPAYFPYGVIYAAKTSKLLATSSFYQQRTIPYHIERWQNYEIDDLCDFIAIEAIYKHRRNTK